MTAGYIVIQTDCQTHPESMQYLVLGLPRQYTSNTSYTILTDLQYVRLHAGLLHERGTGGELAKLARLTSAQLFSTPKPSCYVSELQYVLLQGYCMKQALLMNADSMQDLVLGLPSALHLQTLLHDVD